MQTSVKILESRLCLEADAAFAAPAGRQTPETAEVTYWDAKRREMAQRTVASCSVASCYVMQCHVIQCRATRRRGPPLARGGCCRVAFPSVFFLLVSQSAQSYSSGRGQGSQQRRRAKVQPKMQPVGACSSEICYGQLPLTLLSLTVLSHCCARVQTPNGLCDTRAAIYVLWHAYCGRRALTYVLVVRAVVCVLRYACSDTCALICVL